MKENKNSITTSIELAEGSIVQKTGEAASQMIQAYNGKRYDSFGNEISHYGRNLKQISEYKINPEYCDQNVKQQAGFSAELVNEARKNKKLINAQSEIRIRTTDGIGNTNDMQYDLVALTPDGNVVAGESVQMKFLGVTQDGKYNVIEKIVKDPSWNRYDTVIEIPSDQYDNAVEYAHCQAEKLKKQAEHLEKSGKYDEALKNSELSQKYEDSISKIRKSELTTQEAIDARLDPIKFTVKETVKDCINGGTEMMAASTVVAGAISVACNAVSVFKGERKVSDAAVSVVNDMVKAGASGFVVGSVSTGVKAAMHTASNEVVRKIGTTNAPVMIVTGAIEIAKSIKRFASGEIDALGLFNELGQKGVCAVSSSVGLSIGTLGGAIISNGCAVVGGVIGGMAGYAVAAALYDSVINVLKEEKISLDRRLYLDQLAVETQRQMKEYRKNLCDQGNRFLNEYQQCFDCFFSDIYRAISSKKPDDSIRAFCRLNSSLNLKTRFKSFEELDEFMSDDTSVFEL